MLDLQERNDTPEPPSVVAGDEAEVRAEIFDFDLEAVIDAHIQAEAEAREKAEKARAKERAEMEDRAIDAFRGEFDREVPLPMQAALRVQFKAYNESRGGVTAYCEYRGHGFAINHGNVERRVYWRLEHGSGYMTGQRGGLQEMIIRQCVNLRNDPAEEEIPF